jgi:hypothetical protein
VLRRAIQDWGCVALRSACGGADTSVNFEVDWAAVVTAVLGRVTVIPIQSCLECQ